MSAPVYLLNGTTKVATGYDDMWDGSLLAPINVSENNNAVRTVAQSLPVLTLTALPTKERNLDQVATELGQYPLNADSSWINSGDSTSGTSSYRYYAISELLTVPVPEPSSIAIWLGLAGIGLFVGIRRRQGASRATG